MCIRDSVTGLLVDPHDSEAIANAIDLLLTNRELAGQLGHQGRSRVVNEFTCDIVGKRVQGILSSIVYGVYGDST